MHSRVRLHLVILALSLAAAPLAAQVKPDDATTRLVADVTETFFDLLPKDDFAAERSFMAESLAAMADLDDWTQVRRSVIADTGATPVTWPMR